ncbi:ABC transporter ATP-binding protein [Nakamurella sp. A5-74]|uniref:ABC transporter ATP-binding protein n=1 Tax=Nakamurella sp. A5-74 TaxID=3158264 RepID=A0AAU8DWZ3_9ACTN
MSTERPLLQADGVTRVFRTGAGEVVAVDHVDLMVGRGELVVLIGPSGAGKSTLLNLLAGLDRPTDGRVLLDGNDYAALSDVELAALRRDRIGYVFQAFGLLPMLSARENVEIPLRLTRTAVPERDRRVVAILTEMGLAGHLDQRPGELSGGQQQRVALARALAGEPQLILADEPTAQLDSATAGRILALIHDLVRERGVAAVVTTHDPALIDLADRVIELRGGRARDREHPAAPIVPAADMSPRTDEIPVVGGHRLQREGGRHAAD